MAKLWIQPQSALLILLLTWTSSAQQAAPLSKTAETVHRKAEALSPKAPISVLPLHGEEEYGTFVSSDPEGFTFHDIDLKKDVTLKYSDVRKIKDGYGGYNSVKGKHTDRTKAVIVVVVIAGALGALIGAAAAARN